MRHLSLCLAITTFICWPAHGEDDTTLRANAATGLNKAVTFFHREVAVEGGYVYRYSADLKLREGEGVVGPTTVWVQPPGTPAVGMALLEAWEQTKEPYLLAAAADAGLCLVRGQLHSGGWQDRIDFGPDRKRLAYRVDGPPAPKARNLSTFDDDKTQSALRLLIRLDRAHDFKDATIHEAAGFALDSILKAQHANGAWSQVWDGPSQRDDDPGLRASFPVEVPKTYPGGDYWRHYTFNDNAMADTVDVLLLADDVYREARYRDAAMRCGDFIRRAQLPDPQPGWAQQYDRPMHPVWARKFEPPAVSAGESQGVIRTLMSLYHHTGDARFLEPIPRALDWLDRSALPASRLARFYELKTNRPLYFTKTYELTYDDSDVPTHYAFKIRSDVASLRREYERAKATGPQRPSREPARPTAVTAEMKDRIRAVLASMDARGAWVEPGRLKYHKVDGQIIDAGTFIRNVEVLTGYLDAASDRTSN